MIHIHKAVETFKKKKFSLDNSQGNNLQTEIQLYRDDGTRRAHGASAKGASTKGASALVCKKMCNFIVFQVKFIRFLHPHEHTK